MSNYPDRALILRILAQRNGKSFTKARSNLRRGADDTTESYAVPYVFPSLPEGASERDKTVLLRMAAIAAQYVNIPYISEDSVKVRRKSFGQWCYEISLARAKMQNESFKPDPEKPDVIGQRLAYLHTQDFEEAVRAVIRILDIADSLNPVPPLDYLDLYDTLRRWGNGISAASQHARSRVLRDYYASFGGYAAANNQNTDQDQGN